MLIILLKDLWYCSRFIELGTCVNLPTCIVQANLIFRFFMILHADRGFKVDVSGKINLFLLNTCFYIYIIFFLLGNSLSVYLATVTNPGYPLNTIAGRPKKPTQWLKDTKYLATIISEVFMNFILVSLEVCLRVVIAPSLSN